MDVVLIRTEEGLRGLGEKAGKHYEAWRQHVKGMPVGETVRFTWKKPRSPRFHALFFALLGNVFDAQEQFATADQLRTWLTIGAGHADFVPGPAGRMAAMPKSIAWENMDDVEFKDLVDAVWTFLRTPHARTFLWPGMTDQGSAEAVERMLAGYE
jgi:hypothetical protein